MEIVIAGGGVAGLEGLLGAARARWVTARV